MFFKGRKWLNILIWMMILLAVSGGLFLYTKSGLQQDERSQNGADTFASPVSDSESMNESIVTDTIPTPVATATLPQSTATIVATASASHTPTAVPTQEPTPTATLTPTLPPAMTANEALMGVEMNQGQGSQVGARIGEAKQIWVRYNGIDWSAVEAERGNLNWDKLSGVENDLRIISEEGAKAIVIVRRTPEWAQKVPGALCGPIKEEALADFAAFMSELVSRYRDEPYHVKYWEMGNEVDVDPSLIDPTWPLGCWGDQNDPYYGGGYYAEMLKQVYPAIKEADPEAQVVIGGLLMDCDPTQPPAGQSCLPSQFLEGILRNGGGNAFDVMAYHAYALWDPRLNESDLEDSKWQHRGGTLLGKLSFIREVMARYNINKPIQMNEGGLLCHEKNSACPSETFYNAQATYLPRLYARAWANGLQNAVWYTLNGPGWREGGLLDGAGNPRPAYQALKFMSHLLADATYSNTLSTGELEGYAFTDSSTEYQLYWSNDGSTHSLPVPAGTQAIYNHLGQTLSISGNISVNQEPIYLQLSK